jgi:hypothetical protein
MPSERLLVVPITTNCSPDGLALDTKYPLLIQLGMLLFVIPYIYSLPCFSLIFTIFLCFFLFLFGTKERVINVKTSEKM